MNENKIRKRVKKLLSVTLTASMLVPSISYGTTASAAEFEITAPETDEFTDGAGQSEETSVNEAGVTEDAINVFSDGNLNLAMESSGKKKYTVTIDTENYTIGSETMFDVINNHDGTLTISSERPEVKGLSKELRNTYEMIYIMREKPFYNLYGRANPENQNGEFLEFEKSSHMYPAISGGTIAIDKWSYTVFLVCTENNNYYRVANIQNVENPVEVHYYLNNDGADEPADRAGGPTTDWVWNLDKEWKNDHNNIPSREGYQFKGWHDKYGGNKIETVQQAVSNAYEDDYQGVPYKRIDLYADWIHEQHFWKYILDENAKNIIKAYCSGKDCEYYAESEDNIRNYAVLELGLKGNETNNIIYSGNPVEAVIKNNTFTNAAVSEITYKKMNKDTDEYTECDTPVNAGKYRQK